MAKSTTDTVFVSRLDDDYLECRTIRHSWAIEHLGKAGDLLETKDIPFGYQSALLRVLECERCGMQRHDFLAGPSRRPVALGGLETYQVFARRYRQPKGYLWHKSESGYDRPDQADYNRELFKRGAITVSDIRDSKKEVA